jgi:hypothetical protein
MLSLFDTPQFKKDKEIYNYVIRHGKENLSNQVKGLLSELEGAIREVDKGHAELGGQRTLPIRNDEAKLKILELRKRLDKLVKEFERKNPNIDIR